LQVYKSSEQDVQLVYYVFDLLFVDGKDLRKEPFSTMRKLLAEVLEKAPQNIRSRRPKRLYGRFITGRPGVRPRGIGCQKTGFGSTKAAGAAVPESSSSWLGAKNSLSAAIRCPKEIANISALS